MILLRKPEAAEAAELCKIWAPDCLPGYQLPMDEEEMKALIAEWNRGEAQGRRFYMLMIEADGKRAGLVSLFEKEQGTSLGISVHPAYQKRGIGTKAVYLAEEFALDCGWKTIVSECRMDNAASIALHEKCGFERLVPRQSEDCCFLWQP